MFSSTKEIKPWIMIDLVDAFEICVVKVYHRTDKKINSLGITVGNYVEDWRNTFCARYAPTPNMNTLFCTDGCLIGRYVHITVYDHILRQLQLKEVAVWASP